MIRNVCILAGLAIQGALALAGLAADRPTRAETRRHFHILGHGDAVLFEGTKITRVSEEKNETLVLVSDTVHGNVILRRLDDFEDQTILFRVSDLKDRTFVQLLAKFASKAKTLSETLAEIEATAGQPSIPAALTFETNGGKWQIGERELDDPLRLRKFRHDVRQTTDFWLLEALERMKALSSRPTSATCSSWKSEGLSSTTHLP